MLLKSEVGFSFQLFRDTCPIFTGTKRCCFTSTDVKNIFMTFFYSRAFSGNMEHGWPEIQHWC